MPGRSTMLRPSVRSMTLVSKFDGGRFLSWDGFGGETSHFRSRILYSFPGWLPSFAFAGPDCSSFDSWYISSFRFFGDGAFWFEALPCSRSRT